MPRHEDPFVAAAPWPQERPDRGGRADPRTVAWRRRALAGLAVIGCLAVFVLARSLAMTPMIDLRWDARADGRLVLHDPLAGEAATKATPTSPKPSVVVGVGVALGKGASGHGGDGGPQAPRTLLDDALLLHSPRWQSNSERRAASIQQQEGLAAVLAAARAASAPVAVYLEGAAVLRVPAQQRGFARLGLTFWPLAALALLLYLSAMVVLLTRPGLPSALFMLISVCQAGNLLFIAMQSMPHFGQPPGLTALELPLRALFDLVTCAAVLHAVALHPRRLQQRQRIAWAAWGAALGVLTAAGLAQSGPGRAPEAVFGLLQGGCIAFGAAALATVEYAFRIDRNARTRVLRRLGAAALATLVLVSLVVWLAQSQPGFGATVAVEAAVWASAAWTLFIASLLLMLPALTRSQPLLRELALLAGVSTVATSLDLLFVSVFSLGSFASLAMAVFLALALYAGARQWLLDRLLGARMLSTERAFDHVYRAARELQTHPRRYPAVLVQLLRELYEPLEVLRTRQVPTAARVIQGGAALLVPQRTAAGSAAAAGLLLRGARRAQRLFTQEDARLADQVLEHLRRAVAYDEAVERGRSEERLRIAQDLHDDIGARLLTLMYQAPTRAAEDYLRHTLQDLKTLTRGLAASEHRLSHAAAEWKADLVQRLGAADCALGWHVHCDRDLVLTMGEWSALTRMLRELVSNALFHGRPTHVDVQLQLQAGVLTLEVADDGVGRAPASWAPGLGLGGVKKRVRGLSGRVIWQEREPRGIVCRARFERFGSSDSAAP